MTPRLLSFVVGLALLGSSAANAASSAAKTLPVKRPRNVDDFVNFNPAPDLALRPENARKADALAAFVEGARLEENAELDQALAQYEKVLDVDPGQAELATRVATLLARDGDYPRAIDVLKDAVKANPKQAAPYLQLSFIYARYLKKLDQALKYAEQGVALDPKEIEGYQRVCEIQLALGDPHKAVAVLDRARNVQSDDPLFWTRLGKLYAAIIFKAEQAPPPDELHRVNEIFERAAKTAKDDPAVLRDVADYYAASQQIQQAIPLYLRVLELQPDDANAREKLATEFVLADQRPQAIEMLQEIIKQHPEKYQPYELLAQLLDDDARALVREKKPEDAKAQFSKAAANYEQSILINPTRAISYVRLAELLLGALQEPERATRLLTDARERFPDAPEFTYFLALAEREAKHADKAVALFEEALNEAEQVGAEFVNARFYFDYGVAADEAGLHDKAADLLHQSISLDPQNAAEAYNYLGYMWAEQNSHLDEAEDAVKHALELDANNGAYLDSLGWVYFRRGKFNDALTELLKAEQSMERSDPVVFEHIGDTYAKLNRVPQALEYWQRASALDPQNKSLAEKIEKTKTKLSKGLPRTKEPM